MGTRVREELEARQEVAWQPEMNNGRENQRLLWGFQSPEPRSQDSSWHLNGPVVAGVGGNEPQGICSRAGETPKAESSPVFSLPPATPNVSPVLTLPKARSQGTQEAGNQPVGRGQPHCHREQSKGREMNLRLHLP